jgi:molybdopterin converting factor subunit 1
VRNEAEVMRVSVRFFAVLRDKAAVSVAALELPDYSTVGDASKEIARLYPAIASMLHRTAFAVNMNKADAGVVLKAGDELALLPPVSGG